MNEDQKQTIRETLQELIFELSSNINNLIAESDNTNIIQMQKIELYQEVLLQQYNHYNAIVGCLDTNDKFACWELCKKVLAIHDFISQDLVGNTDEKTAH